MPPWPNSTILDAIVLSLIAGLATGIGGAIVAVIGPLDRRTYDTLLGFAGGIMTAIATLGLVQESLEMGGVGIVAVGVTVGGATLYLLDRYLPHEHEELGFVCANPMAYRQGLMLFAAITLHNVPEGLAVGTGYTASPRLWVLLAVAIALHNIPEGIAVAAPLRACGMRRRRYLGLTLSSGLAEPLGALIGASFVGLSRMLLPVSLAFAGGAMLYVVSDELVPESHSHGFEHEATGGFLLGFVVLAALQYMLA